MENETKKIKIGLSTIFLIIAIILIIIMGVLLYIQKIESDKQIAELHNKNQELHIETIDINEEQIQELYSIVKMHNFGTEEENFYRKSKVTIDDLNNRFKMLAVFNQCFLRHLDVDNHLIRGWGDISVEDFNFVLHDIFGPTATIEHQNLLNASMEFFYNENENTYVSEINSKTNGLLPNVNNYSKLIFAEKINDTIYLYDKFIQITGLSAYPECEEIGVYATSNTEIIIDSNLTQEELSSIVNKYDMLDSGPTINNYEFEGLYEKYKEKILTYKHTFKKDIDGNYYWISSEPIFNNN